MVAQHNTLHACLKDLLFFWGSGPVLLKTPISLSFSRGVRTPSPPLDPHMVYWLHLQTVWTQIRPDKCLLLIRPDKKQNAICWLHLQTVWSQIRPYKLSPADYICKQFGPRSGRTKCPLLIIFANSLNPDQAQQNVLCFCKQFEPESGKTKCKMFSAHYSLDSDQAVQNNVCWLYLPTVWTQIRSDKCRLLIRPYKMQNVICWLHLRTVLTQSRPYKISSGNNYTWYIFKVFSTLQWKIDTYLYLPTLQNITADYICKQFGPRSGPTKFPLLIIFANSSDPDQAQQKVLCWLYLQTVWT